MKILEIVKGSPHPEGNTFSKQDLTLKEASGQFW